MKRYNPKEIEPKWQASWQKSGIYKAIDFDKRQKFVMLTEFPYPSGDGLHMGHVREYTLGDIVARYKRMHGMNVLYPMGYDAFGLPTENFAIKNKIAPQIATDNNISSFQKQFESLGFSFDWSRSFRTSDPDYYKWTQWLFLRFFNEGLAYQKKIEINWCPFCKTGLANEEVINGRHERCDNLVEKKLLKQWLLKITEYADKLIDGLADVDYPSRIADQQVNWIGRSVGAEIDFRVKGSKDSIRVFTSRVDTIFGTTFIAIAPEHPLVDKITTKEQKAHVDSYLAVTQSKSELERLEEGKDKTGIFSGAYAINPVNNQEIPIWIADYILSNYGTGAVMGVPGHDQRDKDFAQKFKLPIIEVVEPVYGEPQGDEIHNNKIIAVVLNPKNNKVIILDWGPRKDRTAGNMLIGGGVEKDEDIVEASRREIQEETGYVDLRFVRQLDTKGHGYFYSNVKNQNYCGHCVGILFELVSDKRKDRNLDDGEKDKFRVTWVDKDRVAAMLDDGIHETFYRQLMLDECYGGEGIITNSNGYDGLTSSLMREKVIEDLSKKGIAKEKINYRLRDWVFSRQHYWGEPIPIIHCPEHGPVAVPDDQLPVVLPEVKYYEPTDTGESPLSKISDWVNVSCPKCGKPAKRETDTMPNWAGSSWYYLRYFDPKNKHHFADRKKLNYWGEVDLYLGGMEHTTMHLLYSRFWHKFFYDQGLVPTAEPYRSRRGQGIILAADGSKMSKSKGNIVNPVDIIDQGYGADSTRLTIAFLAPYDQTTPWGPEAITGNNRFLQRVWALVEEYIDNNVDGDKVSKEILSITHRTIKKVSADIDNLDFNTAISAMMEFTNELYKLKINDRFKSSSWRFALINLIKLLSPFAPHISEELWQEMGEKGSIHISQWPAYDPKFLVSDEMTIVVQINGKLVGEFSTKTDSSEEEIVACAKNLEKVVARLSGKEIKKSIYVKSRLVNFVV